MPYIYPGVYVTELTSPVHAIVGVATSIPAFVGYTSRGIDERMCHPVGHGRPGGDHGRLVQAGASASGGRAGQEAPEHRPYPGLAVPGRLAGRAERRGRPTRRRRRAVARI